MFFDQNDLDLTFKFKVVTTNTQTKGLSIHPATEFGTTTGPDDSSKPF